MVLFTLPPKPKTAGIPAEAGGWWPAQYAGAFHVHTTVSDGGGTRDDVARAAAAAGLTFVILTDHGDGTRAPAAAEYLHGVLVIDGVEIATMSGHYAAFGIGRAPYVLGGPAYSVAEDVARLGGFGVIAHPDSAKQDLRWREWNVPADGIEILNGDSAWRDESSWSLARAIVAYPFRPAGALARLVQRPSQLLRRLDDMNRARRVTAVAGADAHARLPLTSDEEPYRGFALPAPSYRNSFRTFANLVSTEHALTGNAAADAAAILEAMKRGHTAVAMTSLAAPAHVLFRGNDDGRGGVTFEVRTPDVQEDGRSVVRLTLFRDGRPVATADGPALTHAVSAADGGGVWRAEASLASHQDAVWIITTPLRIAAAAPPPIPPPATSPPPIVEALKSLDLTPAPWVIEKHAAATGTVTNDAAGLRFQYGLPAGERLNRFAAAARDTGSADGWDEIHLRARADAPMRLWIQLRLNDSASGQRWGRSIYLEPAARDIAIPLRDFAAMEPGASNRRPNIAQVRAVLLVVDTVNTPPGRAGEVLVESLRLVRRTPAP